MKTLLINPPWFILEEAELGQNATPSGLCYLAAALEQSNYEVKVFNAERIDKNYLYEWTKEMDAFKSFRSRDIKQHPVWKSISDRVSSFKPDLVGISIRTPAVESALYLCEIIKGISKSILIVVGGPHPSVLPNEMLASPHIDFVVRGEGEITIVELVGNLSSGHNFSSVLGLSYKRNDEIIHNNDRPLVADLSTISPPAKHLMLDLEQHDQDDFNPIMTSRGCPYQCIFCGSSNIWGRKVRYRKPVDVIREMEGLIKRFDTRFFSFDDDSFTLNRRHVIEICNLIIEKRFNKIPGFRWTCNTRPDVLDPGLLALMRKARCAAVAIGIESGNEQVLKTLKKNYTISQIKHAAKIIKEAGMVLAGQFMFALPFETEEQMMDTVKLAEEIEAESVKLSVATPLPATALYDMAIENGYFPNGINWSDVMLHNDGILFNKKYSQKDKKRIMSKVIAEFKRIQNKTIGDKIGRIKKYESIYKKDKK